MVGLGDGVLGVVLVLFLIFGFRRGVSVGLFAAAVFVAVTIAAAILAAPLGRVFGRYLSWEEPALSGLGFGVSFIAGLLILACLRGLLKRSISRRPEGFISSVAGALVWGVLGLAFLVLCLTALLVSHRDLFESAAYKRSAACRFVFDEVPVARDLKARIDRPAEPKPEPSTDVEVLQKGFGPTDKDGERSEADQ
jgi:uncharacterized membrane protein required for colicin V production